MQNMKKQDFILPFNILYKETAKFQIICYLNLNSGIIMHKVFLKIH